MNLRDFDALSFDCYGTLIDWEAGILATLDPWAQRHGLGISSEELLVAYASAEATVEHAHQDWLYPQILAGAFVEMGRTLGAPVTDAEAEAFGASVPDWPAFPDSEAALRELKKHYKLIILSNIDRQSFAGSNKRLGVEFDAILTAQDIGSYKPDRRNFIALQETVASMGDLKLLHVAQSLFHDHVPAKEMGLPTVWINRRKDRPGWGATPDPGTPVTPDWEFASMAQFAEGVRESWHEPNRGNNF
jgi:2-haloacid dehalogenase